MEKSLKVILADPPDIQTPWLIANHPNLGILYLSSYLRQKISGIQIDYLETFLSLREHLERLEAFQPDIYGLSFSAIRKTEAALTIKAVRGKFPDLPIICGGAYPTMRSEELLTNLPIDVCVRGEGEATVVDLAEAFQGKKTLDEVAGIVFKRDGQIYTTEKRPLIPELDTIPFPAWELIDFCNYKGNFQYLANPSTVLIASRGCPYDCVFCANPVWKLSKPWMRLRSPANIAQEISLLYDRGIREISIRSDEFNPVLSWAIEICKKIQELGLPELFFQGNIRADKVTDELAREMKKGNFWMVQVGIESGNQRTLDGIDKQITLEQIIQSCRHLKRYGIKVYGYIMIYHAWEENGQFCFETPQDVARTFAFIRKLKKERLIDYMSLSTATPMPGSKLFNIARRHGALQTDREIRDMSEFNLNLPNVSRMEMKKSRLTGMLLQTYLNLSSGHNCLRDMGRNWHKIKTFFKSI